MQLEVQLATRFNVHAEGGFDAVGAALPKLVDQLDS